MPHPPSDPARVVERVRSHQTILVEFAGVAAEAPDLQRLLDLGCQHVARATGVKHSKVLEYRGEKNDLLIVAGKGWRPGTVGHVKLGADMMSPPGRALQTREVVSIGRILDDPEFRYSAVLRMHGIVSLLNAPIAIDGVVWGVVEVDSNDADAFDEDDKRFLLAFSVILGMAVQRKRDQAAQEQRGAELGQKLGRAETLMREQNHRVRNYFQMILAVMAARSRRAANPQTRGEFEEVMNRVTAIGLAHNLLTIQSGQSVVDAAAYIDALCLGIESGASDELRIQRDLEPIHLLPDRAVPVGLILNELVTNCVKYAVKDRPDALLRVRLRADAGTREAVLEVEDDGPGMGEPRPGSLGLDLVRSLAGQLSGRLSVATSPSGTRVTLIFPLIE